MMTADASANIGSLLVLCNARRGKEQQVKLQARKQVWLNIWLTHGPQRQTEPSQPGFLGLVSSPSVSKCKQASRY